MADTLVFYAKDLGEIPVASHRHVVMPLLMSFYEKFIHQIKKNPVVEELA